MVIATFLGGVFMTFVHRVAEPMGEEYAAFNTLLRLLVILGIPAAALQTVFSQQAASAIADSDAHSLSRSTRAVIAGMGGLGLFFCLLILASMGPLSSLFKIHNKAALVFTGFIALSTILAPIFRGILQGQHRFTSLGWLGILDGLGRFGVMILMISFLHFRAAGAMSAVLIAQGGCLLIAAWLTRDVWSTPAPGSFDWKAWLGQVIPLTVGIASVSFMCNIDMLFVQALFADPAQPKLYSGAMITGFAIVQFIAPVTAVMFPRIVQSVARGEKTDTLALTVKITALFGCMAAIGGTLFPKLPLQIIYHDPQMWKAAPLVPWFAWGLLPLTVANVLIVNLLARSHFKALPWLFVVPAFYAGTLGFLSPILVNMQDPFNAFRLIVFTMASFGLLLFGIAAWFTWGRKPWVSQLDRAPAGARSTFDTAASQD